LCTKCKVLGAVVVVAIVVVVSLVKCKYKFNGAIKYDEQGNEQPTGGKEGGQIFICCSAEISCCILLFAAETQYRDVASGGAQNLPLPFKWKSLSQLNSRAFIFSFSIPFPIPLSPFFFLCSANLRALKKSSQQLNG